MLSLLLERIDVNFKSARYYCTQVIQDD